LSVGIHHGLYHGLYHGLHHGLHHGLLILTLLTSCAGPIDRFTTRRLLTRASVVGDVDEACAMGAALARLVDSQGPVGRPPRESLIVAETTAALCEEALAWEADLVVLGLLAESTTADPPRVARIRDAKIVASRRHASTAARYHRAFLQMDAAFGPVGQDCPHLARRQELVYLLGLFSGLNGLLHDRAAGGAVGVALDVPARVARSATCLDDARWWYVPGAFEAAAWAVVPGSGPPDVDPWSRLEQQAAAGEATGVRLARALQVLLAENAGRREDTLRGLRAHAVSTQSTPTDPGQALLDAYAARVSQHVADRYWTAARGHRAPSFGPLPEDPPSGDTPSAFPTEDPFLTPTEGSGP
jgi:hypothetical protein